MVSFKSLGMEEESPPIEQQNQPEEQGMDIPRPLSPREFVTKEGVVAPVKQVITEDQLVVDPVEDIETQEVLVDNQGRRVVKQLNPSVPVEGWPSGYEPVPMPKRTQAEVWESIRNSVLNPIKDAIEANNKGDLPASSVADALDQNESSVLNPVISKALRLADEQGYGKEAVNALLKTGLFISEIGLKGFDVSKMAGEAIYDMAHKISPEFGNILLGYRTKEDSGEQFAREMYHIFSSADAYAAGASQLPTATVGITSRVSQIILDAFSPKPGSGLRSLPGVQSARGATYAKLAERQALAAKAAAEAPEIRTELILKFNDRLTQKYGNDIGKVYDVDKKGHLSINMDKVTEVSKKVLERQAKGGYVPDYDIFTEELYKPEVLDPLVAVLSDFKKSNSMSSFFNPKKSTIENLADILVNPPDEFPKEELARSMIQYGLGWDEMIMGAIGSASEAGTILQKFAAMSVRGLNAVDPADEILTTTDTIGKALWQGFRRFENLRRGVLVSMFATAARNFQSGLIRLPTEALAAHIDTVLYKLGTDGVLEAGKSVLRPSDLQRSFSPFLWVLRDNNVAADYLDLVLNNKQFATKWKNLTDNVNEIRKLTRDEPTTTTGKVIDKVFTEAEMLVDFLNIPNKLQEQIIRRGMTMGELERLVSNEYKIDLLETLQQGKLPDLMQNSPDIIPKGARPFEELVEAAVRKGLQITYANSPDNRIARSVTNTIPKYGLTVFAEFPRFIASSTEQLIQHTFSGFGTVTKKILDLKDTKDISSLKQFTPKQRENVGRNIAGLAAIMAVTKYFEETDADVDYKVIDLPESGRSIDVTAQFPLRQIFWIASAIKNYRRGTFGSWIGSKPEEIMETFSVPSLQRSELGSVTSELVKELTGSDEKLSEEQMKRALGKFVSTYFVGSFSAPFRQTESFERSLGLRPTDMVDRAPEPGGDTPTSRVIAQEMARRAPISLEEENRLAKEGKVVVSPWYGRRKREGEGTKLLFGLTSVPSVAQNDVAKFFTEYGFTEWETSSKAKSPTFRRKENHFLFKMYPALVEQLKVQADVERYMYNQSNASPEGLEPFLRGVMKQSIQEGISSLKALARKQARFAENGDDQKVMEYQTALENYAKLGKSSRLRATNTFKVQMKRNPDMSNINDLQILVELEKMKRKESRENLEPFSSD